MPDHIFLLPRPHVCEACGHISTLPARAPPARVFLVRRLDAPAQPTAFANVNHAYLHAIRCTLTLVEQLAEVIVPELRAHAVDRALGTPRKRLEAIETWLDAAGIECARFTVDKLEISGADDQEDAFEESLLRGLLEEDRCCSGTGSYTMTSVSSAACTPASGFGLTPEFSTAPYGDFPEKDFTYSSYSPTSQDGQQHLQLGNVDSRSPTQNAATGDNAYASTSFAPPADSFTRNGETDPSRPFQTAYSASDLGTPTSYSPTGNGAYFGFRPIADCAGELGFDSYVGELDTWTDKPNYSFLRDGPSSPSYNTDTATAADGGGYGFAVSDLADATASLSLLRSMGHDVSDPAAIGFWTPGMPYIPPLYPATTDDDVKEKRTDDGEGDEDSDLAADDKSPDCDNDRHPLGSPPPLPPSSNGHLGENYGLVNADADTYGLAGSGGGASAQFQSGLEANGSRAAQDSYDAVAGSKAGVGQPRRPGADDGSRTAVGNETDDGRDERYGVVTVSARAENGGPPAPTRLI
ncbi:hypothetical protein HDU89_005002 [Geranomyces variabilis]|nr:hypothetical protein HDU89_005002 [Geranomyces variabilis]